MFVPLELFYTEDKLQEGRTPANYSFMVKSKHAMLKLHNKQQLPWEARKKRQADISLLNAY